MKNVKSKFKMASVVGLAAISAGVTMAPSASAEYITRERVNFHSTTVSRQIGITDGTWNHVQIDLETMKRAKKNFKVEVLQNDKPIQSFTVNTDWSTATFAYKTRGSGYNISKIQYRFTPIRGNAYADFWGPNDIGAYIRTY